jgi:helicase
LNAEDWRSWPLAKKVLAKGALDGDSLLIAAPTGTGKSYTASKIMLDLLKRDHQGVSFYLVPLKALAEEAYERFKEEMMEAGLDTSGLAIATGDYDDPVDLTSASLVVATYEKLLSLLKAGTSFSTYVVIADEFQIVADSQRGPRIEALMSMRFSGSNVVLFVLSAVVGNPQEIAKWLKIGHVLGDSSDRRVPLRIVGKQAREPSDFVRTQVAAELSSNGGTQLLIFCNKKDATEKLAKSLSGIVAPKLKESELESLRTVSARLISIGKFNSDLAGLCEKGVAYHHSLLTKETRKEIESAYKGTALKVICCTPTLAQGVNTPARVVIVRDITRFDGDSGRLELLPLSELLNMIGRAGRPNFDHEEGTAYLVSKNDVKTLVDRLRAGKGEPLKSTLGDTFSNVAKFVLQAVRNTEGCDAEAIMDQASKLLWAHQNGLAGSKSNTTLSVEDRLRENFESELERGQVGRIEMHRDMSGPFIQANVKSTHDPEMVYRVRVTRGSILANVRATRFIEQCASTSRE